MSEFEEHPTTGTVVTPTNMNIAWALFMMRRGGRVRRPAWKDRSGGRGNWLELAPPYVLVCGPAAQPVRLQHFEINDVLATDWEEVEEGDTNV